MAVKAFSKTTHSKKTPQKTNINTIFYSDLCYCIGGYFLSSTSSSVYICSLSHFTFVANNSGYLLRTVLHKGSGIYDFRGDETSRLGGQFSRH